MSEENLYEEENLEDDNYVEPVPDELSMLKERADLMGVQYHPNIGIEKLKAKIAEKTAPPEEKVKADSTYAGEEYQTIMAAEQAAAGKQVAALAVPTPLQERMARRDKSLRLVRVRIANMNPIKGNMKGEIFSVGNAEIGFTKKFVPFNAEQGWHIPEILLGVLQNKKFMTHYEVKMGNKRIKKNRLVPEYSIEILPPLTPQELEALKQRQLMAQGQS